MDKLNIRIICAFFVLFFLAAQSLEAQENRFSASAVAGISAAQLGGDSIAGYDKMGMTVGLRLSYDFESKFDVSMELLYSQRGSRSSIGFSSSGSNTTVLNYIEIPVYVTLNDWLIEKEDYYKVGIFGGLSYGYLISASSTNNILRGRENEFNDHDISLRVGVYYAFNKNLIFRTYYTDSLVDLVQGDLFNTDGLNSFFWTFRLEYRF